MGLFALCGSLSVIVSLAESSDFGPSVVVHTSVSFGAEHLEEDVAKVQHLILNQLEDIIPSLPKPASIKCQRWTYSQVSSKNDRMLNQAQPNSKL